MLGTRESCVSALGQPGCFVAFRMFVNFIKDETGLVFQLKSRCFGENRAAVIFGVAFG